MKTIEQRAEEYVPNTITAHIFKSSPLKGLIVRILRDAYIAGAKDQKAIDEEVRLKKSDDMTEAEYNRETAFVDWYLKNGKGTPTYSDAIEWARKDVISKACDWLHLNLPNIEYTIKEPNPLRVSRGLLIDELKKAMDK